MNGDFFGYDPAKLYDMFLFYIFILLPGTIATVRLLMESMGYEYDD